MNERVNKILKEIEAQIDEYSSFYNEDPDCVILSQSYYNEICNCLEVYFNLKSNLKLFGLSIITINSESFIKVTRRGYIKWFLEEKENKN